MSSLEFKRVAFSNEIQFDINRTKVDGNMVKRMASGGDEVEVRTNYKDETRKRLQSTMFLYCNDFPSVAPDDAYTTLEVFRFRTTFVEQRELDERKEACPSNWMAQDNDIKTWIRNQRYLMHLRRWFLIHMRPIGSPCQTSSGRTHSSSRDQQQRSL